MKAIYLGLCAVILMWYMQAEYYGKVFSQSMPAIFRSSSSGYNHK